VIFKLVHTSARENAVNAVRQAPDGWVVKITEPTRNLEQNALLHAELHELAQTKQWCRMTLDVDQWKRLMTSAWLRATGRGAIYVQALDGQGMDVLYKRTSTMTKAEMSELIEYVKAWKAENVPEQKNT
jgi:hypothetical protein